MSNSRKQVLLTPVGRFVQGSLYEPNTTDMEGRPLKDKSGADRVQYYMALALPKAGESHWSQTDWGQVLWATGHAEFPNGQTNSPTFAWKVLDGDNAIPDGEGRRPCDKEGWAGHWILKFTNGFAPQIVNHDGSQYLKEKDAILLGDYIQVSATVSGNGSTQKPGLFLNVSCVALNRQGQRISTGIDPKSLGFGKAPLPAGALLAQPGTPVPTVTPAFGAPAGYTSPTPPVTHATVSTPAPHYGILTPPVPVAVAPQRVMLPPANGATYEQLIAAGWTDLTLVQHGLMQA